MARINVDNEVLCDPRLVLLSQRMSRYMAIGALVSMWEVGQAYWKKNKSLIPYEIFNQLPKYQDLEDCGFVELREEGIYCKGAEERWHFLLAQSENGKKSAAARKRKYGTSIPINSTNFPRTKSEPPPNQSEHSSSSSFFNTNTHTREEAFLCVFELYPKKTEKMEGLRRFKGLDLDIERLKVAVANYSAYIKQNKINPRYIKKFSSFLTDWQDWLNFKSKKVITL